MDQQDRQPRPSAASGRLPRGSAARRTVPPDTFRYTLANLEDETGIAGRNIRYYISQGLLPAAEGRGPSATYTQSHLLRLQAIALMRDQDLPLKTMKERLADLSDDHIRRISGGASRCTPGLNSMCAKRQGGWTTICSASSNLSSRSSAMS